MKHTSRFFRPLSVILLLSMLLAGVVSLSSCGPAFLSEEKRAVYIYRKAEELLAAEKNATTFLEFNVDFDFESVSGTMNITETMKVDETDGLRILVEEEVTTRINSTTSTLSQTYGYMNGKGFWRGNGDGMWSEMTESEFEEWREDGTDESYDFSTLLVSPDDAAVKTCTKDKKTGDYTVSLQQIGEKNLEVIGRMAEMLKELSPELVLKDADLYIVTDKEMRFKEIEIVFAFGGAQKLPETKLNLTFSDYGTTEIPDPDFEKEYLQVEDVRLPARVAKIYRDTKESDSFTVISSTKSTIAGQTSTLTETDKVRVNRENGYIVEIDADVSGQAYLMKYADGVRTTTQGNQTIDTVKMTEKEMKSFVESLIDPTGFTESFVSSIYRSPNHTSDTDPIFMSLTDDALQNIRQQYYAAGLNPSNGTARVEVRFKDAGEVELICVHIHFNISAQGYSGEVTVTCTLYPNGQ